MAISKHEDGFLLDPDDWNEKIATQIAKSETAFNRMAMINKVAKLPACGSRKNCGWTCKYWVNLEVAYEKDL